VFICFCYAVNVQVKINLSIDNFIFYKIIVKNKIILGKRVVVLLSLKHVIWSSVNLSQSFLTAVSTAFDKPMAPYTSNCAFQTGFLV
jgi:hypothetical protein